VDLHRAFVPLAASASSGLVIRVRRFECVRREQAVRKLRPFNLRKGARLEQRPGRSEVDTILEHRLLDVLAHARHYAIAVRLLVTAVNVREILCILMPPLDPACRIFQRRRLRLFVRQVNLPLTHSESRAHTQRMLPLRPACSSLHTHLVRLRELGQLA
jgi:hypothetical protein